VVDGIVLGRAGGRYRVFADATEREATLRGRMKHQRGATVLVGDRVGLALHPDGGATIEVVRDRRSVLRRRRPGRSHGTRAIAANIDRVVVIGAARSPGWDPGLIDRFTAVAEANQLPALVVVNKADLDPDAPTLGEPYRRAGYEVLITSVPSRSGIAELGNRLRGCVSLFTGPTGAGKSSLLNALVPGLRLRTGEVSRRSGAGRHTTVAVEMHALGDDGFVVDTPGLRDIGLWGLAPLEVAAAFPEFTDLASGCRFDNCRHRGEPGCEVVAAAQRGEIAATRLASYRQLLEEAELAAKPWG
jgi:ribosome biogenesis GTPase